MDTLQQRADSSQAASRLVSLLSRCKASGQDLEDLAVAVIDFARRDGKHLPPTEENSNDDSDAAEQPKGLANIEGMQFITPRAKFDVSFHKEDFAARNAKQAVRVKYGDIRHIAIVDQIPKDTKGRILLVIETSRHAMGKQKVGSEVIVLQVSETATLDIPNPKAPTTRLTGPAAVVLCQAFGAAGVPPKAFVTPNSAVFQSSDGSSAVEAVMKVDQGWLFPLEPAFCFLEKPATWVSHTDIEGVEFTRVGSNSRSFDIHLHLKSGSSLELAGIEQRHADGLLAYCARCKLEMDNGEGALEQGPTGEGASSSEEEDSDFDPEASSASEGGVGGDLPSGRTPASGSESSDGEEAESDGSDISVVSDEEVPSSKVRGLIQRAGGHKKRKREL